MARVFTAVTSFAHEVGHSLGAAHHRADYEEDELPLGAYTFSHGTVRDGVFSTISRPIVGFVFISQFELRAIPAVLRIERRFSR